MDEMFFGGVFEIHTEAGSRRHYCSIVNICKDKFDLYLTAFHCYLPHFENRLLRGKAACYPLWKRGGIGGLRRACRSHLSDKE